MTLLASSQDPSRCHLVEECVRREYSMILAAGACPGHPESEQTPGHLYCPGPGIGATGRERRTTDVWASLLEAGTAIHCRSAGAVAKQR